MTVESWASRLPLEIINKPANKRDLIISAKDKFLNIDLKTSPVKVWWHGWLTSPVAHRRGEPPLKIIHHESKQRKKNHSLVTHHYQHSFDRICVRSPAGILLWRICPQVGIISTGRFIGFLDVEGTFGTQMDEEKETAFRMNLPVVCRSKLAPGVKMSQIATLIVGITPT
jgi:hypothetical protein